MEAAAEKSRSATVLDRFNKSHKRKVYACLAVTCHLHFWQNDRDFLRAVAVTRGWNGYRNKGQHRKSTLEKKILPLLAGIRTRDLYIPLSYPRPPLYTLDYQLPKRAYSALHPQAWTYIIGTYRVQSLGFPKIVYYYVAPAASRLQDLRHIARWDLQTLRWSRFCTVCRVIMSSVWWRLSAHNYHVVPQTAGFRISDI